MSLVDIKWGTIAGALPYTLFAVPMFFIAYTFLFDPDPQTPSIVGVVPLVLGCGFALAFVARAMNKTTFEMRGGRLRVTTSPVPVGGKLDVALVEVRQFVVETKTKLQDNHSYYVGVELSDGRVEVIPNNPISSKQEAESHVAELNTALETSR